MIIFIFNGYFPDNSGFGKRCKKEIEILLEDYDVYIICRGRPNEKNEDILTINNKKVKITRFFATSNLIERVNQKYIRGFYEVKRNLDLFFNLALGIMKTLWKNRSKKEIKIYTVTSPLTVPFIAYWMARIFNRSPEVIEFHDLEPELAMHIKSLSRTNYIIKIEFFLEKFLVQRYKKTIVTNRTQLERIKERSGISSNRIFIIPNSIQVEKTFKRYNSQLTHYKFAKNDFIVAYVSNFTYDYTISGMIKIFHSLSVNRSRFKNIRFLIIGDGDGLRVLKNMAKKIKLENIVIFIGRVENPSLLMGNVDIGIIPWSKNEFSETVLPTKLFEYMVNKKAIIAPNFGEFKNNLVHKSDSLIYNSTDESIQYILELQKNQSLKKRLESNAYNKYLKSFKSNINEKLLQQAISI